MNATFFSYFFAILSDYTLLALMVVALALNIIFGMSRYIVGAGIMCVGCVFVALLEAGVKINIKFFLAAFLCCALFNVAGYAIGRSMPERPTRW